MGVATLTSTSIVPLLQCIEPIITVKQLNHVIERVLVIVYTVTEWRTCCRVRICRDARGYYASTASGIIGNIFSEHYSSIIGKNVA